MRKWLLLLLLLAVGLGPLAYRWMKDCSHWPPMDVVEYWLMVHQGCCYEILETRDEYICLAVQGDHDRWYHRMDRTLLTRQVQEETYRLVVQRNIARLKEEVARRETIDPRRLAYVQQGIDMSTRELENYTGLSFDLPEQWILWWEGTHERLRLAPDGQYVIVGP